MKKTFAFIDTYYKFNYKTAAGTIKRNICKNLRSSLKLENVTDFQMLLKQQLLNQWYK